MDKHNSKVNAKYQKEQQSWLTYWHNSKIDSKDQYNYIKGRKDWHLYLTLNKAE